MTKKLLFSIMAIIIVGLIGAGLIFFMSQQEQPERQLFGQADFHVADKYIRVDRMEWPDDRMELKYVDVSKEQQYALLELFENATFEQVEGRHRSRRKGNDRKHLRVQQHGRRRLYGPPQRHHRHRH